jgi:hypothetical protein
LEKITPDWSAEDVSKLAERLEGSDRLDDVGRKMAVNALRSLQCKLECFQKPVTEMGYDNLDALVAVHQRNVKWLEAIRDALSRYRVSLTKTEAEAFRDLTRAIEEPPE